MANYNYDEAGNMAAYFLLTFLLIVLVPLSWPSGSSSVFLRGLLDETIGITYLSCSLQNQYTRPSVIVKIVSSIEHVCGNMKVFPYGGTSYLLPLVWRRVRSCPTQQIYTNCSGLGPLCLRGLQSLGLGLGEQSLQPFRNSGYQHGTPFLFVSVGVGGY